VASFKESLITPQKVPRKLISSHTSRVQLISTHHSSLLRSLNEVKEFLSHQIREAIKFPYNNKKLASSHSSNYHYFHFAQRITSIMEKCNKSVLEHSAFLCLCIAVCLQENLIPNHDKYLSLSPFSVATASIITNLLLRGRNM